MFEGEGNLITYFKIIYTLHWYYFYVLRICFSETKLYEYQATEVRNIFPCTCVVTYWQYLKILNISFRSERGVFYSNYQFSVHWALFKEMYKISIPFTYKLRSVLGRYEPDK